MYRRPPLGPLKTTLIVVGSLIVVFGGIQAVPYGHGHINPQVFQEPTWDDPSTHDLAVRACYHCHSNTTEWPWFSEFAPYSWFYQRDIEKARSLLDFSEFDRPQPRAHEAPTKLQNDPKHGADNISAGERNTLIAGLAKTFSSAPVIMEKQR
jgi:hypothetical protein